MDDSTRVKMKHLTVLVLAVAAAIAANALEHGEGLDNPIIEFFEAPVRAFKTKVAEDVQPISSSAPEGKSVGIAKSKNNSWFRGKGLADWLMSRNAATTASPEVASLGNNQQVQAVNAPNRRRLVRRQNVRQAGNGGQYAANGNWRRNANPNRRRVYRRPYSDEDAYSDEDEYDDFSGGRHYQMTYDSVPYRSASYEDEEDEPVSYVPQRKHHLRRGQGEGHKRTVKPNSSYLQPFQDMPLQARPVRLRQNLPVTKPIRNKSQQGTVKPATNANQNQGNNQKNKNKKKKNKHKNKNKPSNTNTVQQDPMHFIVHPQGNGQLPMLIPVNNNNNKNKVQNVMNDPNDYQNYQYIPIPVQGYGPGGYKGIPQIRVIAQHTHTFRPHGHGGFPTEVILGPGGGFDGGFFEQSDNVGTTPSKRKPNKNKVEMNSAPTQNQKIILTATNGMQNETPMTMLEEQMAEPTKQTIVVEELKPETTLATQTASGDGMLEMTIDDDDKLNTAEVRSVDGRPHIVVPRHIFPIFGASSLVEVANNGRFFLKTGRDLKVDDPEEEEALIEVVEENPEGSLRETITAEIPKELLKEQLPKDELKKDEPLKEEPVKAEPIKNEESKSEVDHSVTKKDEASLDEPLVSPSPTPASIPESETAKPQPVEKNLPSTIPVRPEQLEDIPVKIVHEEPVVRVEKSPRSVTHEHKPLLKSEVVHEKANGHFIVKSGVAPVVESRSNVRFHGDDQLADSEIQHIKITPIENSRAL